MKHILVCDHRGNGLESELAALDPSDYVWLWSQTLRQSLTRLGAEPPDLILLDPLSSQAGVELRSLEDARGGGPPVPVLLFIDPTDPEAALRVDRCLERGAWDVVPHDARPEEILLRMRRLIDQHHLAREMIELRHQASHDDRTDLLRPNTFQARLVEHFSAAQRHKHELALVLVDLDKFGQINKQHDHTVGDTLISGVGEAIRRTLRVEDVAGRLGGDEFAVILPYTGKLNAARVVSRLRDKIRELSGRPPGADADVAVSASIGFETYDGSDLDTVETLRRHAERALRVAKQEGGDRGVYFRSLDE